MLVAIIDIGSNSVRLVFYDYAKGYPQAIFNEKVTCTLGEGLQIGDKLLPDAKQKVRATITRFTALIRARKPEMVQILATAAIREASDGAEFAKELEAIIGEKITILSGEQESLYAAYGVIATAWQPCGIVVDMGGGSTDISYIDKSGVAHAITSIPHGSLYFSQYCTKGGSAKFAAYLNKMLAPIKDYQSENIYPVGGSFRAIATHHMARNNYPLNIIHDYNLPTVEIAPLIKLIEMEIAENIALIDVPKRRQNAILPALITLEQIAKITTAKDCIFSASGIREGALAFTMNLHHNPPDPLIAMMRSIHSILIEDSYVDRLCEWINEIISVSNENQRILQAFCYISEIAANMHPEYRAEYAFERIIAIQGFGLTHSQQVILALCAYFRYRSKLKLKHPALSLLNDEERNFAYAIGRLAYIAYDLSAGCENLLSSFKIKHHKKEKTYKIICNNPEASPVEMPEIHQNLTELITSMQK